MKKKSNNGCFHTFRYRCYIFNNNNKYNIEKFEVKFDEGTFLRYSTFSKMYSL